MAIADSFYRLKINVVYSNQNNANTALANINNALATTSRTEVATKPTSTSVYLSIVGLSEEEATSLALLLNSAWSSATRNSGKVSVVRSNDLT